MRKSRERFQPVQSAEIDNLGKYLNKIGGHQLLDRDEEFRLAKTRRDKEKSPEAKKQARTELIEHNLRLVVSVAKGMHGPLRLEDRIAAGNIGLIEGVDHYREDTGNKLGTYATYWIRKAVHDENYREVNGRFGIAKHDYADMAVLRKAGRRLGKRLSRNEIAEELNVGPRKSKKLENMLEMSMRLIPLDKEVAGLDSGETTTLGDLIADTRRPDPLQEAIIMDMVCRVNNALKDLKEQERSVLVKRFGLDGGDSRTLESVGKDMGLSRERVRQIETAAREKILRHPELRELL